MASAFLIGVALGVVLSAVVAGWVWLFKTPGNDHPLTREEIRERVGEAWG
jgi:hypothetical protein